MVPTRPHVKRCPAIRLSTMPAQNRRRSPPLERFPSGSTQSASTQSESTQSVIVGVLSPARRRSLLTVLPLSPRGESPRLRGSAALPFMSHPNLVELPSARLLANL